MLIKKDRKVGNTEGMLKKKGRKEGSRVKVEKER